MPRLVIIGPPGAGKSTVGELVAERLGVPFFDTDAAIEVGEGRSIAEIFIADGESAFRALERDEVVQALAVENGVVALGGGAPMDPDIQRALEGLTVVFLDVGIADAAKRVGLDQSRPLLAVNPRATWTALMNGRRPIYERLSTHRVDTAGRAPQDIADEVVRVVDQA
jgi:shikimate kinase